MANSHSRDELRSRLRTFSRDRSGNVVIIFGLALIPILGLVGAAVDYSRAGSARTAMQVALDAAALTLSKEAATLTSDQVMQKGTNYFMAEFNRPDART